ncbi:MAG: hypothetical protein IJY91_07360 [Oscillospiraceae bacterium]|nr:hypothetical protein [Oscillospiraceae bacterium]
MANFVLEFIVSTINSNFWVLQRAKQRADWIRPLQWVYEIIKLVWDNQAVT